MKKHFIITIIYLFIVSCNSIVDQDITRIDENEILGYTKELYSLRDLNDEEQEKVKLKKSQLRYLLDTEGFYQSNNIDPRRDPRKIPEIHEKFNITEKLIKKQEEINSSNNFLLLSSSYKGILKNWEKYKTFDEQSIQEIENQKRITEERKENERLQKEQERRSRLLNNFPGTYINYPMGEQNYHITNKITIYSSGSLIFESTFGSGGYESGNWRFTNDTGFELMMTYNRLSGRIQSNGDLYVSGLGDFEKFR